MSTNWHTAGVFSEVTPNDSTDLTVTCDAIYIGTAGTITVHNHDGVPVPFPVAAGQTLNVKTKRIMATGTDVDGLVALSQFT